MRAATPHSEEMRLTATQCRATVSHPTAQKSRPLKSGEGSYRTRFGHLDVDAVKPRTDPDSEGVVVVDVSRFPLGRPVGPESRRRRHRAGDNFAPPALWSGGKIDAKEGGAVKGCFGGVAVGGVTVFSSSTPALPSPSVR